MRKPPQALKSPIMAFVVRGRMIPPLKKRRKKTINCGMAIMETMSPRLQEKIIAVKKSRIDLEIKIEASPVIPDSRLP